MSESLYVLIGEDHPEDAEVLQNELRAAGFDFNAHTVKTEQEFLAALAPVPDLILADYRLPQFSALGALELLRERSMDIPLIIVARSIGEELAVEAIKQGAADYLKKDRLMRLGIAVRRALVEKRERDDKRRAETRLRHASLHDPLTGLYNRAYFDEELRRLERGRISPVSVIVADVDELKVVNDQLGHAAGDEMLLNAALVLGSVLRRSDVAARIGGDEFSALLPGADEAAARKAIERVKHALKEFNRRRQAPLLSLSLGYSTGDCAAAAMTFKRADANMYTAKAARRARVNT